MLPSTGLFKAINCPFFESEGCRRPFCHFKHARKDDEEQRRCTPESSLDASTTNAAQIQILEPPIVYKPTPKSILERKASGSPDPVRRKTKLEYVPKSKHSSHRSNLSYTPASTTITPSQYSTDGVVHKISEISVESQSDNTTVDNDIPPVYIPTKIVPDEKVTDNGNITSNEPSEKIKEESSPQIAIKDNLSSHTSKHRSSSKSHSSSTHSKSKHRDKDDKRKSRDRHNDSKSHKSSSGSSSRRSSKSELKSSTIKHSGSERTKNKKSTTDHCDSSKNTRRSSFTEKSRKHSRITSSSVNEPMKQSHNKPIVDVDKLKSNKRKSVEELPSTEHLMIPSPSSVFDTDSDEDDVMAQCRLIFDEFKVEKIENGHTEPAPSKIVDDTDDGLLEGASKRKRLAYAHAEDSRPKHAKIHTVGKNHAQAAMESVFARHEAARKQFEEMEKQKEIAAAEDTARLAAIEAERAAKRKARQSTASTFSGSSSSRLSLGPSHQQPLSFQQRVANSRTITPVSNIIAIQEAKKKIDMIKANKIQTIPKTAPKTAGRVAHVNSELAKKDAPMAPPVLEPKSTKISYNLRMQYYNMMVKHCLTIYDNCSDAWDRAQTEELSVFKKCNTPVIYKSSALLAVNKLRKESLDAGNINTEKNKIVSHDVILAGKLGQNTSWSVNKKLKSVVSGSGNTLDTVSGVKAYEMIYNIRLTEEQLRGNGYPRSGIATGTAKIYTPPRAAPNNEQDRYCRRCGKVFRLDHFDEDAVDQCNYHLKSPGYRRGFADNSHRCCQQPAGTPGCMYANYHVTDYMDYNNLHGFVKTIARSEDYESTRKDIFALDCEMCYTTMGLELTRVTVVDINLKRVYDSLVKPDNRIVDYNTTFSGITEQMMEKETTTLRNVQAVLLSMFHSKSILIGHSLESDLKILKLIHDVVVDTSVLFPHKMGPPKKRALKTLCIENLKRIIQEDDGGHDSAEDAEVCIQLVKHYLRNATA